MMSEKRRNEIRDSLLKLIANYRAKSEDFEENLRVLCRKLELEELTILRSEEKPGAGAPKIKIGSGDLVIDRATFTVRWNGQSCFLNNSLPFRMLERLARRPNQFVSYEQLFDEVWGGGIRSRAAVRSVVKVLRQKLNRAGMREVARAVDGRTAGHYALSR